MENNDLGDSISKLTKAIKRSNNLWWSFLRGIFYSFGWVLGLAIIATLAYYLLQKIDNGNLLGRLIQAIANTTN